MNPLEKHYKKLFKQASQPIFVVNMNAKIIDCSYEFAKELGYSYEESLALEVSDFEVIDSKEEILNNIKNLTSTPISFYSKYKRKDKSLIDVSVTIVKITISNEDFICSSFTNITEKIKSREELSLEKNKYKNLMLVATDGIHILDKSGNLIDCSYSFTDMLGYEKSESTNLNVKDWDCFFEQDKLINVVNSLIENPKIFNTKHIKKDGTIIDVQINAKGIIINEEEYLYASSRDITQELKLKNEILEKTSLLNQVKKIANLGYWKYNIEDKSVNWSDETYNIFEIDKSETITYERFMNLVHKDDLAKVKNAYSNALIDLLPYEIEYRIVLFNGKIKYLLEKCEIITNEKKQAIAIIGTLFDLTKQYETRLNLQNFIDSQNNIVILTNGLKLNFANKKFFDFLGFENLENFLKYHNCICEFFIQDDEYFHLGKIDKKDNWLEVVSNLDYKERIVSIKSRNEKIHYFDIHINKFSDELKIVSFNDISNIIIEKAHLEKLAYFDNLTGAYTRDFFVENQNIFLNNREDTALVMLDLDHFKKVNDTYGHQVGDLVLKKFVQILKEHTRLNDFIFRWGGEEFLLVIKIENNLKKLSKILEKLRESIETTKFPKTVNITCSMGASFHKKDEKVFFTIKRVDAALYKSKSEGRNKVTIV